MKVLRRKREAEPMIEQSKPFTVEGLEAEITEQIKEQYSGDLRPVSVVDHLAPSPLPALPSYVEHAPGTPEVGRLTAEVVVREYEAVAKSVEQMSAELIELQRRMEAEIAIIHEVTKELAACAERARTEGKAAFERVEAMSKITAEVRENCAAMSARLLSGY